MSLSIRQMLRVALLQSRVLQYAVPRTFWQILFRVWHRYKVRLLGVFEVMVAPFYPDQLPSILFQHFDELLRVHSLSLVLVCNYTHALYVFRVFCVVVCIAGGPACGGLTSTWWRPAASRRKAGASAGLSKGMSALPQPASLNFQSQYLIRRTLPGKKCAMDSLEVFLIACLSREIQRRANTTGQIVPHARCGTELVV